MCEIKRRNGWFVEDEELGWDESEKIRIVDTVNVMPDVNDEKPRSWDGQNIRIILLIKIS